MIAPPAGSRFTTDGLLIRATKFQKSLLLPLHDTVGAAFDRHLKLRSQHDSSGGKPRSAKIERPPA
jgi:hypothetical protein